MEAHSCQLKILDDNLLLKITGIQNHEIYEIYIHTHLRVCKFSVFLQLKTYRAHREYGQKLQYCLNTLFLSRIVGGSLRKKATPCQKGFAGKTTAF